MLPTFYRRNISVRAVDLPQAASFHTSSHISLAAYNRLYIPELLGEYAKALYLDCDTTIHTDVAELYDMELGNNYLAACEDYYLTQGTTPYYTRSREALRAQGCPVEEHINSGVLSMNLAAMRRDNMQQRMLECAASQDHYYHDQCVLNITCKGKILPLPLEWNTCVSTRVDHDSLPGWHYDNMHHLLDERKYKILHFISEKKPWNHLQRPMADRWWLEAGRVPYAVATRLFHIPFTKWLALRSLVACIPGKIGQAAAHRLFPAFRWKN